MCRSCSNITTRPISSSLLPLKSVKHIVGIMPSMYQTRFTFNVVGKTD